MGTSQSAPVNSGLKKHTKSNFWGLIIFQRFNIWIKGLFLISNLNCTLHSKTFKQLFKDLSQKKLIENNHIFKLFGQFFCCFCFACQFLKFKLYALLPALTLVSIKSIQTCPSIPTGIQGTTIIYSVITIYAGISCNTHTFIATSFIHACCQAVTRRTQASIGINLTSRSCITWWAHTLESTDGIDTGSTIMTCCIQTFIDVSLTECTSVASRADTSLWPIGMFNACSSMLARIRVTSISSRQNRTLSPSISWTACTFVVIQ